MEDLHSLADIYEKYKEVAISYLQTNYGAVLLESENKVKYPTSLLLNLQVNNLVVSLIINIPFNFPDAFPQVKLDELSFEKVFPIPHLDIFKTLCLFDDVVASPNPRNPIGLLEVTLEKSLEILSKGISKQNVNEYIEEFDSYWLQESEVGLFLSLVEPSEEIKTIFLLPCALKRQNRRGIFADKKSEAIKWIQNIGGRYDEEETIETLYVPLKKPMSYPFPKNNKEIYHLLKENELPNLNEYITYLDKKPRPSKVLFSIEVDGINTWGIWEHTEPFKWNTLLYKGRKRTQRNLKGFRKKTRNGRLEIIRDFPEQEINKYYVEDVRASRLSIRGGDGDLKNHARNVVVIGCGAVGSHLIQGLFDIGVQHMLLIDYDTLSFENINRHVCGASDVGSKKTDAIKNKLRQHYPTSQIHVCSEDIMTFLKLYPEGLNSYDLIISAISNAPIEQRMNELQLKGVITPPVLNIWVEPYLAAGHAIWIESTIGINISSLFDKGKYKYQVLKNGNQYTKKELGCSTSYVPYGALELKKFTTDTLLFICQQWEKGREENIAFTWLGNLTEQRKNQRYLEPRWVGATDFSTRYNYLETFKESAEDDDI
ncbi:ThiF family adenylyltransferase [Bacillus sp. EB106-08-02-XG196]|uniref:ThiF family adenylyltransferase n=1 Tax=Bacillus sp. EB106-08-02-XG196 TaxID=2737049 RepID=UPI0015C4DDC9|nr:ThiF family adenylyltransferase [Bacillus sp. EB106-08-02-XG196]NWQ40361.1 ThiF family adenylyltransferase [Bacillus sp. EB106-08-02-XG196]